MATPAENRLKAEKQQLEREVLTFARANIPIWPDLDGVVKAFTHAMGPRHRDTIRKVLNSERGRGLQRRQMGNRVHYCRDQLPPIIAAYFLEESEPLAFGVQADPSNGAAPFRNLKRSSKPAEKAS